MLDDVRHCNLLVRYSAVWIGQLAPLSSCDVNRSFSKHKNRKLLYVNSQYIHERTGWGGRSVEYKSELYYPRPFISCPYWRGIVTISKYGLREGWVWRGLGMKNNFVTENVGVFTRFRVLQVNSCTPVKYFITLLTLFYI